MHITLAQLRCLQPNRRPGSLGRAARSRHRGGAFTLIELLVVIAIIAILAAILFPVFALARENARKSACQSNLHQIGLAFAQYEQDYDERYPANYYPCGTGAPVPACTVSSNIEELWYTLLNPYIKSVQVWNCPDAQANMYQGTGANGVWTINAEICYGMAWYTTDSTPGDVKCMFNDPTSSGGQGGALVSAVPDPSGTIMLAEAGQRPDASWGYYHVAGFTPMVLADNQADLATWHEGGNNMLWADGHVKWMNISQVSYTRGAPVPSVWTG